jgi:hypothetical protein
MVKGKGGLVYKAPPGGLGSRVDAPTSREVVLF